MKARPRRRRAPIAAPGSWSAAIACWTSRRARSRRSSRACSTGWRRKSLAFHHLEHRGCARAQKSHVAADCEKAHAAFGKRDRALRGMAIGAHDLSRFVGGRDDALERGVDLGCHGVDFLAVAERDRKVGGTK